MEKKWQLISAEEQKINELSQSFKINKNLYPLLIQRSIDSFEKAKVFFRPELAHLHNPFLMKDMDKAVVRILKAIDNNEKIMILGDYDVDGTTSVAVLYKFIKEIYENILYYIPNRFKEGYGVSKAGIDFAIEAKINLLITVDCGIKSEPLIQYAFEHSIETIICDHHLPPDILPPAIAILNPKQIDCLYPCKDLCGCGIVFKLITALSIQLKYTDNRHLDYLDLVSVAIAADIVPMIDENRTLAVLGLEKINSNPQNGLKSLLQFFKHDNDIKIRDLVFLVSPRINAAGRMDDAKKAVELFIADSLEEANVLAQILNTNNEERRSLDKDIFEEAKALIESNPNNLQSKSTVVYQPHWNKGVIGIVASRLIECYYKPTIVLTKSGEIVSGSARTVEGFNLYNAIQACEKYLIGYGGHFAAAGLTMLEVNINPFIEAFENAVQNQITEDQLIPTILINTELNFIDITKSFYQLIQKMEPFGPQNMHPLFISKNVRDTGYSEIVKDNHIKFSLEQNGHKQNGIGFNMSNKFDIAKSGKPFQIVYKIMYEMYNQKNYLKLNIIDLKE